MYTTTPYPGDGVETTEPVTTGAMTSPWALRNGDDYTDTNSLEEVVSEYLNE